MASQHDKLLLFLYTNHNVIDLNHKNETFKTEPVFLLSVSCCVLGDTSSSYSRLKTLKWFPIFFSQCENWLVATIITMKRHIMQKCLPHLK